MEPVAIFLLLIVLALIILFVTRPFIERPRVRDDENNQEFSSLLADRDRLLTSLQELDFDQSLGKIPAEDYPAQRAALLQKGSDVLRQMDALSPMTAKQGVVKEQRPGSMPNSNANVPLSADDLEDLVAKRRYSHNGKTAGFCHKCGKPVLQSDVFCPTCGSPLKSN